MKKFLILGALTLAMALTGCSQSTPTVSIADATTNMQGVSSFVGETLVEVNVTLMDEDLNSFTRTKMDTVVSPLQIKQEISSTMDADEETTLSESYFTEVDGGYQYYTNTGTGWFKGVYTADEIAHYAMMDNLLLYLSGYTEGAVAGTEKVNGVSATRVNGTVDAHTMEAIVQHSGLSYSAQSLGLTSSDIHDLMHELDPMTISFWIDKDGYIIKCEADLSHVTKEIMLAALEALAIDREEALTYLTVGETKISLLFSDFNSLESIEIPEDLLGMNTEETQTSTTE